MAGPVASVLVGRLVAISEVEAILHSISRDVQRTATGYDFWTGDGRPFLLELAVPNLEEVDYARVREEFGLEPRQEVLLCAMCNDEEDHELLGELALHFASDLGGVVDFDGSLHPWADSVAGRIVEAPYKTDEGQTCFTHVADTTFLRNWLMHPSFHMIK